MKARRTTLTVTDHDLERCQERQIKEDAAVIAVRFGEEQPGRRSNERVWYVSPMSAYRARQRGRNLWSYVGVAIVTVDGVVVTAYWLTEDEARRRRAQEATS